MSQSKIDFVPTLSILDRLSQPDSDNDAEVFLPQESSVAQGADRQVGKAHARTMIELHKKAVKRDLEWLFNTRRTVDPRLENYPQLASSVFAFGLPDISTLNVSSSNDRGLLARDMQAVVEVFDPRLHELQIGVVASGGSNRFLQFRIDGVLMMEPAPEEVVIDAVLHPAIAKYEVK